MRSFLKKRSFWVALGLLSAGVAVASPWDIDMVDARSRKAYGWKMMAPKPEGTLFRPAGAVQRARPTGFYQNDYIAPVDRLAPAADLMKSPYGDTEAQIKTGERVFQVSCQPCHGVGGDGNGTVTKYDPANGFNRFAMKAPPLSGEGAAPAHRSDGYIYGTIRNGGAGMPAYAVSLTDAERWAVVSYVRTFPGATWLDAPKAPEATLPTGTATVPADPKAPATKGTGTKAPAPVLPKAKAAAGKSK